MAENTKCAPLFGYDDPRSMLLHRRIAPLCNLPDPRFINLVADRVTMRSQSVDAIQSAALVTVLPPALTGQAASCAAEVAPEQMQLFPNGWLGP